MNFLIIPVIETYIYRYRNLAYKLSSLTCFNLLMAHTFGQNYPTYVNEQASDVDTTIQLPLYCVSLL